MLALNIFAFELNVIFIQAKIQIGLNSKILLREDFYQKRNNIHRQTLDRIFA